MKYKDPNQPVEVRVKDLLSRMTLEEKIGQMTQIDRVDASFAVVNKYYLGNVVFYRFCIDLYEKLLMLIDELIMALQGV